MKRYVLYLILCLLQSYATVFAQESKTVRYAPAWFGPNANPVPEMTDARIPLQTTISVMGDYYFGSGDHTKNGYIKAEVPLLPGRVSFKAWSAVFEHYNVSESLAQKRGMLDTKGNATGDLYLQTRIALLRERRYIPAFVLNSTLRTASGTQFDDRRYYDTPGYYFDLEFGKSFHLRSHIINQIRLVGDVGFMCWETTNSTQNDGPMYGGKLILSNKHWRLENSVSGYDGWISKKDPEQGDAPSVYTGRLTYMTRKLEYFTQYQYGINDFPYQQTRVGFSVMVDKLTPKCR